MVDVFPEEFAKEPSWNNKFEVTLIPPIEIDRLMRITNKYENFLTNLE